MSPKTRLNPHHHPLTNRLSWINLLLLAAMLVSCSGQPTPPAQPAGEGTAPPSSQAPAQPASSSAENTAVPAAPTSGPTQPPPTPTPAGLVIQDEGDPALPRVIERQPAGGKEMAVQGEVLLAFDQDMDQEKTAAAWKLADAQGRAVDGKISWKNSRIMSFKPNQPLSPGSAYTGNLSTGATSSQGAAMSDPFSFKLNTASPLQVSQVFPANGTSDVAYDSAITAIFNRPVVPLVSAEDQASLPQPLVFSPPLTGQGTWVNTSMYTFRPDPAMKSSTLYQVTIQAGLQDAAHESSLPQDYTWSFITSVPRLENLGLSNGVVGPDDDYKNFLLDDYFRLFFNQAMDRASVEAALSLTSADGQAAALRTAWEPDSTQVVVTPSLRLALGTDYLLKLDTSARSQSQAPLEQGLDWHFTTIPAPQVISISPDAQEELVHFSSQLIIHFASPMRLDTIKDKVQITPAPVEEVKWWYNDYDWSAHASVLQPSTRYTVRTLPGMEDIYGNKTTEVKTASFTTPARPPEASLVMPYQVSIFRSTQPQEFYTTYRNVKRIDYRLYRVKLDRFIPLQDGSLTRDDYQPGDGDLVWNYTEESTAALNERVTKALKMTTPDGGLLPTGFYLLRMEAPVPGDRNPMRDNRLLIVASANLSMKSTGDQALMWMTDLQSGAPQGGVSITAFNAVGETIGSGVTGQDGTLLLQVPVPADAYASRYAMAGAPGEASFGFVSSSWGSGDTSYEYGLWGAYYAPPRQAKAYIYTERPIYRPGQPVYFKGIVRVDDDLDYSLPVQKEVVVRIESYKETIFEETLPLSENGGFDGQITLDKEAALGYYTISAHFPGEDNQIGALTFNVAEYRRPEFQVQVSAGPADVLPGDTFSTTVDAQYFSGGAVPDAQVNWTLTADPFYFSPPASYSGFSFSDYEDDAGYYRQDLTPGSEMIAEGQGQTGPDGKLSMTLPVDLSKFKTSMRFTFEAMVTDVANTLVSGRAAVTAHRSAIYPGIRSKTYIGTAGKPQELEVVALDWNGAPVPGVQATVEVVERRWNSVQEQDANGRINWTTSVEEIPITSTVVTLDGKGLGSLSFTPPNGGVYRARVTTLDSRGNQGAASTYVWVTGKDYIPWRQTNDRSFSLVTDRTSYKPGDQAQILIASPFQGEAYALLTVERGRLKHQEVLHLTSNSTIYPLPITPDMAPNVYVSVLVVKGVDETNPRPNFKMGITELQVATNEQQLSVEVSAEPAQAGPGETVQYTVRTRDSSGQPVDAEVSLSLSDLATMSLMDPNSEPILSYFYNKRTLGVWTSVGIDLSIEDYNTNIQDNIVEGEGGGSGGGKGGGDLGVVEVRQDFPDTAYWKARLQTGASGEATVSVTLPDNLTTWRMDARAATLDTRVGQTTQDLISTKPLLVRPQTPRFFVAGDQAQLGTAVHNNTGQALSVQVSLEAQGFTLQSPVTQTVEIPPMRQAYVTWDGAVDAGAARVDLVFRAASGELSDASRPTLGPLQGQGIPVYHYEAPETVGTSGQLSSGGQVPEMISLPAGMEITSGSLEIQVAPSLVAGMTDGLTYLKHYPYECVEQTISRFLPNVITARAMREAGVEDAELSAGLEEQVNLALQRLYNWQNADGGWYWWPGTSDEQPSDPQTSAYAVLGLLQAGQAGYTVSQPVMERALEYLKTQVMPLDQLNEPYQLNRQAFILYVLAQADMPNTSAAVQLYQHRQSLALYAEAYLAQALYHVDPQDPQLKTVLADFNSAAITSASGAHWEEKESDLWNWNTDTRSTAIILSSIIQIDPANPLTANAVRWLMSNRTNGHWAGTQETAWTLMALTEWMAATGEMQANYEYGVALNDEQLGGGEANAGTLRQTLDLRVDISQLLKDQANRLVFGRSEGPGTLYYTTFMKLYLPVEKTTALDRGIQVSRLYYRYSDLESLSGKAVGSGGELLNNPEAVTQAQQGDLVLVRLTVIAPYALHNVVIDDPLPAGLEAVDQALNTSPQEKSVPQQFAVNDLWMKGWGWWYFDNIQLRDEKAVLSADYLPAGTYVYTYLARASTPGSFRVIPPTAQEFYFPDVYGRGAGSLFTVTP